MKWGLVAGLLGVSILAGCARPPITEGPGPGSDLGGWQAPHLDRVWRRLRAEPPFISGLMLVDGPPPRAFVDDYFDGFHATAVHFWEAGLPRQLADWEASGRPRLRFFSWVDKDGTSRDGGQVLGGIGPDRPGRVGFQIGDEPGLDGTGFAGVLPFRQGVEAVRRADPEALVVMNFSVGVRDLGRILDYAGGQLGIDIFSFDRYNLSKRQYATLALIRRYAQKYHRPYWRYLYGYRQRAEDRLTPSDLRWDAMSGLVYGFTGFTWFIYQNKSMGIAPAFFDEPGYGGAKSPLWYAAAEVNRDLSAYLGVTRHLWSTDVRYRSLLPALQPEGTRPWRRGAGGDPYLVELGPAAAPDSEVMEILVGFFRDDAGEHYAMLQNARHARGSPPNDSEEPGTIRLRFDFSGAPSDLDPSRILIFDPARRRPRAVVLEPRGPRGGVAELRVAAGDVALYKYATGRPFPGGRPRP
ncbi:MAG: hypothetical protein ACM3ST_10930 [Bdellovibrio bacteriovorus]